MNFNSTMVRLEATCSSFAPTAPMPFQFHYGSIGRAYRWWCPPLFSRFQFHYGSIGSWHHLQHPHQQTHFNSTMVRLEGAGLHHPPEHFGISIPLWFDWKPDATTNLTTLQQFQFHYGSIGRQIVAQKLTNDMDISIPLWFDWKKSGSSKPFGFCTISIPLWFDWKYRLYINCRGVDEFQFHYGSIGRFFLLVGLHVFYIFQFHYGSIGSCYTIISVLKMNYISIPLWFDWKFPAIFLTRFFLNFNSTMVRLEVWYDRNFYQLIPDFNSTMVRLEVDEKAC